MRAKMAVWLYVAVIAMWWVLGFVWGHYIIK